MLFKHLLRVGHSFYFWNNENVVQMPTERCRRLAGKRTGK